MSDLRKRERHKNDKERVGRSLLITPQKGKITTKMPPSLDVNIFHLTERKIAVTKAVEVSTLATHAT